MAEESAAVIYGAPLIGVLLLSVGIAGGVMGGYSVVQQELDLCGEPTIRVASAEASAPYAAPGPPDFRRIPVSELSPGEREAFHTALEAPSREAEVAGAVPHLDAFRTGALVIYGGGERYVTLLSTNDCVDASPLLFPIGIVFMLVGIGGVLTPPILRHLKAFETVDGDRAR